MHEVFRFVTKNLETGRPHANSNRQSKATDKNRHQTHQNIQVCKFTGTAMPFINITCLYACLIFVPDCDLDCRIRSHRMQGNCTGQQPSLEALGSLTLLIFWSCSLASVS